MEKRSVFTALVFPRAPADEYPIWSPDNQEVALSIYGDWLAFNLAGLILNLAEWHNDEIGIVAGISTPAPRVMDEREVHSWRAATRYGARKISSATGLVMELREVGWGVSFVTTDAENVEKVHWTSEGENCHSMSLSPDDHVLLFICELNGVFAWRVPESTP